jgi:hypothetical protein
VQNDIAASKTQVTLPQTPDLGPQFNQVMIWIMTLFAWLVGVAAITLDNAVYYTVVTMGNYVNGLSAIGVTWRVLRDIGNIMLIFGFLGAGIATILNVEKYGWSTKMLPMLLVAAVSMNFSLFVAEAMVDGTNLVATQFYSQINGGPITGPKNYDKVSVQNDGIASKIMSQVGLQTLYGQVQNSQKAGDILKSGNAGLIGFMAIILFLVTAFVMFSLAFILIARFVALILLLVVSPVAFMGMAIPQMQYRAGQWWKNFLEQIVTAPVLLLLLYVALAVITDAQFLTGFGSGPNGPDWLGFVTNGNLTGFASIVLSFLVAMGLLLVVVIKAKSMSAFGASWATKTAGTLTFGATAWAGRATVGTGIGRGLLGNRLITRGAVSDNKLVRYGARTLGFAGKRLQNRTFDVRNAPGAAAALGALHIDAGKPSQLTAKQLQEKQYGVKPTVEWFRNASMEYEKDAKALDRKKAISDPAHPDFTKTMKKMSVDELSELRAIRKALAPYVATLSPAKYAELQKSDKLLESEKKNLKTTWDSQFTPGNAAATLARFSTEEISSLDGDALAKIPVIDALGTTEFDAIRRKGNLTRDQRHAIFDRMTSPAAPPALSAIVRDYFLPANDVGGARSKYWNV